MRGRAKSGNKQGVHKNKESKCEERRTAGGGRRKGAQRWREMAEEDGTQRKLASFIQRKPKREYSLLTLTRCTHSQFFPVMLVLVRNMSGYSLHLKV